MPNVPITLACALYDRMQALYTGDIKPEGIDLTFRVEDFPRKLFDHAMAEKSFDVCEMSSSDYVTRYLKGDCPFVALPVFPSKMFRHGNIVINAKSGIRTPKDLEGKRVGVMRHTMTAAVWIRGHLQNDYGVDLKSIKWLEGSINTPGMHGVPTIHPPGWDITVNQSGKSLSQLIDAGEIDATIGTHLPDSLKTNPDVQRIFPNFREVEESAWVNALKSLSVCSLVMPMPLSRTSISTLSGRPPRGTASSRTRATTAPVSVNFTAFEK
jgi:4,5-dihydroxyphthalate decarboxylase